MRKRTLLAIFVILLLIGAYGAYVISYPKYPEVKGCVNPFAVTKPVSRVQENWSEAHVFFKLVTTRDFWKLAKPWQVDYSHVKVVKHTIEYNGEKITMLAMGIPLKDKKHVIALYEFSKPIQGIKIRSYLLELDKPKIKTLAFTTNGKYQIASNCPHECSSNSDCGEFASCEPYCCSTDWGCAISCCLAAGHCRWLCRLGPEVCIACIVAECAWCAGDRCCEEWGSKCVDWGDMP